MKKYDLEFVTEETNYGTNRNTMHFFVMLNNRKQLRTLKNNKRKEANLWKIII